MSLNRPVHHGDRENTESSEAVRRAHDWHSVLGRVTYAYDREQGLVEERFADGTRRRLTPGEDHG